jgi:ATP-dependent DNA ligase
MVSQDCEITGFYEGKNDTKHIGRLGGVVLKQENGLACECGSGFSDESREYIWNNQAEFLGRVIECKYQELSVHNIMRFPIFIRFRDDKGKK